MSSTEVPIRGSFLMPALEHARVADAMHPGVLACQPDASLTDVARLMAANHVHCIVVEVADGAAGDKLVWATITDRQLLRAALALDFEPTAASIAGRPIVRVGPDMPLLEAAELMMSRDVSHVLVTDPASERPIGILSTADIAGVIAWGEA